MGLLGGAAHGLVEVPPTKAVARIGLANPRGLTAVFGGSGSGADLGRYASARAQFAESTDVLVAAAEALRDGTSAVTLRTAVEVTATPDADVLTVTATAPDARQAERRADAVVAAYQKLTLQATNGTVISQLAAVARAQTELGQQLRMGVLDAGGAGAATTALAELQQTAARAQTEAALFGSGTVFVEKAAVRDLTSRVSRAERGALLGLLVGVLVAGAAAWVRAGRRREVEDSETIAQVLGTRLLGEIPAVSRRDVGGRGVGRRGVGRRGVGGRGVGGWERGPDGPRRPPLPGHHAAAGVLAAVGGHGLFVVAGAARHDGRTTTALGLATALAAGGSRVALIDGDLRTGRLTTRFGLPATANGLAQLAAGTSPLADVVRTFEVADGGDITFIPRGQVTAAGDLVGLLRRPELTETFTRLKKVFDIVLVDTPAAGSTSDAFLLAATATGIIAVARWRSPVRPLYRLHAQAEAMAVPLVGVVVTRGPRVRGGYDELPAGAAGASGGSGGSGGGEDDVHHRNGGPEQPSSGDPVTGPPAFTARR
ncbi:AAA family ATPase [Parafrankia colletiae]|uniref:AAA family ATPase n=1 Tax=Parafrankia colletiae TaxID=573497 RepID=UPI001042359C|nr:AAA family ATPase [Parafrankia colletiae]